MTSKTEVRHAHSVADSDSTDRLELWRQLRVCEYGDLLDSVM